jgi:SAM-dependent methyltransferase
MSGREGEAYGERGSTWVDRFGVWLSQRAIRRWLPDRPGLEVLELGCGYHAANLVNLPATVARATAVDFKLAPGLRANPRLVVHEGAIEEVLPTLPAGRFDVVLVISVLEHLVDPLAALRATHAVIRPGGLLLVNVPTWRGKVFLEFSAFRLGLSPAVEMDDHKNYFDKRDLWPLLVQAGFRPSRIRLRYHKFGLNLFGVVRRSDDADS